MDLRLLINMLENDLQKFSQILLLANTQVNKINCLRTFVSI